MLLAEIKKSIKVTRKYPETTSQEYGHRCFDWMTSSIANATKQSYPTKSFVKQMNWPKDYAP